MNPHDITKKVVAALETEQSRDIYLPRFGGWLWMTKGLPAWALDGLVWVRFRSLMRLKFHPLTNHTDRSCSSQVSGANEATQGFVGSKAGKED